MISLPRKLWESKYAKRPAMHIPIFWVVWTIWWITKITNSDMDISSTGLNLVIRCVLCSSQKKKKNFLPQSIIWTVWAAVKLIIYLNPGKKTLVFCFQIKSRSPYICIYILGPPYTKVRVLCRAHFVLQKAPKGCKFV